VATCDISERSTTHRIAPHRFKIMIAGTVAALGLSLLAAMPAGADPTNPATSDEAQQAWLDSSQRAEALNDQVLGAQESEQAAAAAAAAATGQVAQAKQAVDAAQATATTTDAAAAGYQAKLNAFANASFRGGRMDPLSVLLTADSAEDYLYQVSSLDRVAADTQQTLDEALAAKAAAQQAKADADAAQATAEKAKSDADAAQVAAQQATAEVTARKGALDAEAAHYRQLAESLSEQERQAATAAAEQANAAANQAAAPAPAAANRSRTDAVQQEAAAPAAAPAVTSDPASAAEPAAADPAPAPAGNSAAATAVAAALSKEGAAYVYGAAGPNAFDCSGLTSWAWAQAGVTIPRTSSGQGGLPVVPLGELQPGDLVTYYSPVSHVAMYIGGGQVIHASTESRPVYITSVGGAGPNPVGHRVG
jgi:cell wall-associated NlpC family hydrolase